MKINCITRHAAHRVEESKKNKRSVKCYVKHVKWIIRTNANYNKKEENKQLYDQKNSRSITRYIIQSGTESYRQPSGVILSKAQVNIYIAKRNWDGDFFLLLSDKISLPHTMQNPRLRRYFYNVSFIRILQIECGEDAAKRYNV